MDGKSYKLSVKLVNNSTGELLVTSCKPVAFFSTGDGEEKLNKWLECLVRGLRKQNDGLTLELDLTPIVPLSQPLIF